MAINSGNLLIRGWQIGHRNGGAVFDRRDLFRVGQDVLQLPTPACRVGASAVTVGGGPIQNLFNATAHPGSGFGLRLPDRRQRAQHVRLVNLGDRQPAEVRRCIGGERVAPLLCMLGIAPCAFVFGDEGIGGLVELQPLGGCQVGGLAFILARLDRVGSCIALPQRSAGRFTRCGQRHAGIAAKAHAPTLTHVHIPQHPGARPAFNPQIQAADPAHSVRAFHAQPGNLQRRHFKDSLRHGSISVGHHVDHKNLN